MGKTWGEWQVPAVKFPHIPIGFPKLAKTILLMTFLRRHLRLACGRISSATVLICPPCRLHDLLCAVWYSDTNVHMLSLFTVMIKISSGLPPCSSNSTRKLSFGFKKERGTWYLKCFLHLFINLFFFIGHVAWHAKPLTLDCFTV